MDYFNDVLTTFLCLERGSYIVYMQGQKALEFHQKYLNLCSEEEQNPYGFERTWVWVINDIFIFLVNYPFNLLQRQHCIFFYNVSQNILVNREKTCLISVF